MVLGKSNFLPKSKLWQSFLLVRFSVTFLFHSVGILNQKFLLSKLSEIGNEKFPKNLGIGKSRSVLPVPPEPSRLCNITAIV